MPAELYRTNSAEQTQRVGRELARRLPRTGLLLLTGDLGAGKTTLVKGIAEGRQACPAEEVTSPTFTLVQEYGDPPLLYHVDLYRLETAAEVETLGLEELLDRPGLVVIEWGERFPELWPPDRIEVRLSAGPQEDEREILVNWPE